MTVSGRLVARAVAWSSAGALLLRLGQLLIGVVVARLLSPHDFGLFAVVLVVYLVVVNISEIGVGSALIREDRRLDALAPTAVTLSLVSSLVLGGVMALVAPALAGALGAPGASGAIRVMSLVVVLAGPAAVPAALLTREFSQHKRFVADLANFVVGNALLLVLAVQGHGVMALVWSRVVGQLVSVVVLTMSAPTRYWPGFHPSAARSLLRFGLPLVGANLVGYSIGNVDSITIGRIAGPAPLGTYTLANNVAGWPMSLFTTVLVSVGLPVMSAVRHQREVLSRYLANAVAVTSLTFFFVTAMCVALAQPLVDVLYGPAWKAAGPVLAILAVFGSVRVLLAILSDALVAVKATRSLFAVQALWLACLVPCMVVGVRTGHIVGAALVQVLVSALLVLPVSVEALRRVTRVPARPMVTAGRPALVGAVLAGAAAHLTSWAPGTSWLSLLAGGAVGSLVYALVVVRPARRTFREIRELYGQPSVSAAERAESLVVPAETPAADASFGPLPSAAGELR